jgi:hypothetical protein
MVFLGCLGTRDSKIWLGWVWIAGSVSRCSDLNSNVLPSIYCWGFSWWFVGPCTCLQNMTKKQSKTSVCILARLPRNDIQRSHTESEQRNLFVEP